MACMNRLGTAHSTRFSAPFQRSVESPALALLFSCATVAARRDELQRPEVESVRVKNTPDIDRPTQVFMIPFEYKPPARALLAAYSY